MSKSTSISDLPKNDSQTDGDIQESMMVNSILKEIENEEEVLNDENEESLNYVMDTSQIPPKIQNEMPSPEMIKTATEDLFNQEVMPSHVEPEPTLPPAPIQLEEKKELNVEAIPAKNNMLNSLDGLLNKVKKRVISPLIILVLFMIITLEKVNKIIIKIIPRLGNISGGINTLGNLLKGIFISIIYFIVSFFI